MASNRRYPTKIVILRAVSILQFLVYRAWTAINAGDSLVIASPDPAVEMWV